MLTTSSETYTLHRAPLFIPTMQIYGPQVVYQSIEHACDAKSSLQN